MADTRRSLHTQANRREREARTHNMRSAGAGAGVVSGLLVAEAADKRMLDARGALESREQRHRLFGRATDPAQMERWAQTAKKTRLIRNLGAGGAAAVLPVMAHQGYKGYKGDKDAARLRAQAQNLSKAGLPGDNPRAESARDRRQTGLGVAGVGYLSASRGKDVAPGAADLVTRSTKAIGPAKRRQLMLTRESKFGRVSGIGGAALVGGGLVLAGEGAITDWASRGSVRRTKKKIRRKALEARKELIGVGKSYTDLVLAKAFDDELAKIAMKAPGLGGLMAHLKPVGDSVRDVGTKVGTKLTPVLKPIQAGLKPIGESLRPTTNKVKSFIGDHKVATGLAAGTGVAAAGGYTGYKMNKAFDHERAQQDREAEARDARVIQRERPVPVRRGRAYDPERSRRNRQAAYTGVGAGGAVVAGAHGVRARREGRALGREAGKEALLSAAEHKQLQDKLHNLGQIGPSPRPSDLTHAASLHASATGHAGQSVALGQQARKFTQRSRASLAAAALLGAGAYGVHDYDRRRGGRPYGY